MARYDILLSQSIAYMGTVVIMVHEPFGRPVIEPSTVGTLQPRANFCIWTSLVKAGL